MLSTEQEAILEPAWALVRNSKEVVVAVPDIGVAEIA
jgi:hypothetical protein